MLSISVLTNAEWQLAMEMLAICAIIALVLIGATWFRNHKRRQRYPPGPGFALPVLGNLLQLGSHPHLTFQKWKNKYGPLIFFKMADRDAIVVSCPKLMKELLPKWIANGRPQSAFFDVVSNGGHGVLFADGQNWDEQRAFAVRTLRELGLSKKGGGLEEIIIEQGKLLLQFFEKRVDVPIQVKGVFNEAVICSLWTIVSGERHEWIVDGELKSAKITRVADELGAGINYAAKSGLAFVSWLRHVAPEYLGWNGLVRNMDKFFKLAEKTVEKHVTTLDTNDARDFIDHHLIRGQNCDDSSSSFYKETGRLNLVTILADLFVAGNETTATALEHAILYLGHHPHVQVKLQQELDTVLKSRHPTLADRERLPYTQAVILETLRFSSVLSMPSHRLLEDYEFHGYLLPKNCILFVDLYSTLHDDSSWDSDVNKFHPERFLSPDGTQITNHDAFIPFGAGRRLCIGEALAKDTLFLFLTSIFQKFIVELHPSGRSVDYNDVVPGFTLQPKPFQICVKLR